MAEAFGVAAGVVGVAGFAVQLIESTIKLRELYKKTKDAPAALDRIIREVETFSLLLREIAREHALHPNVDFDIVERCFMNCQEEMNRVFRVVVKLSSALQDPKLLLRLSAKLKTAFKDDEIRQLDADVMKASHYLHLAFSLYQEYVTSFIDMEH